MAYKKILILGTGKDQTQGILKAKGKGYFTVGLDYDPLSACASLTDEFHQVNIKNIKEVVGFCKKNKNKFAGVIAFGVDIPEIIAAAAKELNCYTPISREKAEKTTNKLIAKDIMKSFNVNLPDYQGINSISDLEKFVENNEMPAVLKPVDNSASRGVLQINKNSDLKKAFEISLANVVSKKSATPLIVETFLKGRQLSSESILYKGKLFTIGIADRNYQLLEKFSPFIIENGGDLPAVLDGFSSYKQMIEKIDEELIKTAHAFGIENGIIKGDLVVHNGEIFVIEVAFRLSGGHFSTYEIPMSTGVDFLSYAIDIYTDNEINCSNLEFKVENFVKLRYFLEETKTDYCLKKLKLPNVSGIIADFYLKEGDSVKGYSSKLNLPVNKIGYYIVSGKTRREQESREKEFLKKVVIERG